MNINRVYFHVPFCQKKCAYCIFHSIVPKEEEIIDRYLLKIERDLNRSKDITQEIKSIYIGGGTPSLLSAKNIARFFEIINRNLKIAQNAEISIECNPESLDSEKVNILSSFVNRISLGVQSLNPKFLETIGRNGNIYNLEKHIEGFLNNGIHNISCDLIYGIPRQQPLDFFKDLNQILSLGVKHFSAYSLTLEEGSKLNNAFSSKEMASSDINATKIWKKLPIFLKEYGFQRYEISNYSKEGSECKHNIDAWFGGRYIGFGPTASSYDGTKRWTNSTISNWFEDKKIAYDQISQNRRMMEIFSIGLRSIFDWKISEIPKGHLISNSINDNSYIISKKTYDKLMIKIDELSSLKLLKVQNREKYIKISSTKKGQLFWNDLGLALI